MGKGHGTRDVPWYAASGLLSRIERCCLMNRNNAFPGRKRSLTKKMPNAVGYQMLALRLVGR